MNPTQKFSNLDIKHLPGFEIPSIVCKRCRGISWTRPICSVCGEKKAVDLCNTESVLGELIDRKIENKFLHAEGFSSAIPLRARVFDAKTIVEELCENSMLYIHFVTYSIDTTMLNFLEKALKRGVEVAGFIGLKPSDFVKDEIINLNNNYGKLGNINIWEPATGDEKNLPHHKILVCDGCVALTGSMNLTEAGFKKHAQDIPFEFVWPFTDIDSVAAINNEYISPFFYPEKARYIRWGEFEECE